jgi:ABC-type uncharacterized transport system ATPase subunit
MSSLEENKSPAAIEAKSLTYKHVSHNDGIPPALVDLSLGLPKGSRTLLIGANGGKLKSEHVMSMKLIHGSWKINIASDTCGKATC